MTINNIINTNKGKIKSLIKTILSYGAFILYIVILDTGLGHTWAIIGFFVWALAMPIYNYVMIPQIRELVNNNMLMIVRQLELMIWGHTKDERKTRKSIKSKKIHKKSN